MKSPDPDTDRSPSVLDQVVAADVAASRSTERLPVIQWAGFLGAAVGGVLAMTFAVRAVIGTLAGFTL